MSVINGRIPASNLAYLSTPGRLTSASAKSYERLKKATGTTGTEHSNEAYRSYDEQIDTLEYNYTTVKSQGASGNTVANGGIKYWNGKTWYRKPGRVTAAIPGTSNHGYGVAVDFQNLGGYTSSTWKAFAKVAAEHGWSNTEGRAVNEPWHWVYNEKLDKHKYDGGGESSTTTLEEPVLKNSTFARTKPTALKKDAWVTIKISNTDATSFAKDCDVWSVDANLTVTGLPVGAQIQWRVFEVDCKTDGTSGVRKKAYPAIEGIGTAGSTFLGGSWTGSGLTTPTAGRSRRLRLEAKVFTSGVKVTAARTSANQWTEK